MRFGVVGGIEGILIPVFLTKTGEWSENLNDMETFSTLKEACEAAMNCVTENHLAVSIEFSGYIRSRYEV